MRRRVASRGLFLGLLFCWAYPVDGENYPQIAVSISGRNVSLTCHGTKIEWLKKTGGQHQLHSNWTQTLLLTEKEADREQYTCRSQSGVHLGTVYLKVKACDACVELSLGLVAGIVLSDLLVTLGVLLVVYYCSKSRVARLGGGAAGGGGRRQPRGQKTDSPPPVPNPDYEPIRKGQREVYAGLEPSRAF